eukprot:gnl/MRDRNA2_/MRDRNA2_37582_c0_seq1.p1 gnl/MRDRNA2_/MRDRNA2_37582_c0~~gnl/MRDRNA2_/MRDRNA2_37582_c0_seq1.p1  ORF type:complete len:1215 (+),score=265.67 gnl/MRDRNA2_/MRDRNA2_37582_c0_seq1:100-3744(+)
MKGSPQVSLAAGKKAADDDKDLALLRSIRKLREDSERIADYNESLSNVLNGCQQDQVVTANRKWEQDFRLAMHKRMNRYVSHHMATLAVSIFSLWRQQTARIQALTRLVCTDDQYFRALHLFWAWHHCFLQEIWQKQLQEGMEGCREVRKRCEEQLAEAQAKALATQNQLLLNQLKTTMGSQNAAIKKDVWIEWRQVAKDAAHMKQKQSQIIKAMARMLQAEDSELLEKAFRAFREEILAVQKQRREEQHQKEMEELAMKNMMRMMTEGEGELKQIAFKAWSAESQAAKRQRESDREQSQFQKTLDDALRSERQQAEEFRKTYAEKAVSALFATQSPEAILKSYFGEWRSEAVSSAAHKRKEKMEAQIRRISDGQSKNDKASEVQAKNLAIMFGDCFKQMCFHAWVCYHEDTQRARRLQIEAHQVTIKEEINRLRHQAWQFEASHALHALCEWIGGRIDAQRRDTLQHWHSKRWTSHRVIAAAVLGEHHPAIPSEMMSPSAAWAQAAEEELQIMQRRVAEPIAQRKSLEDHIASMYDSTLKKQRFNMRVVSRVLNDDESDRNDLKEAFLNWKANLGVLQAWRLEVEWENRATARQEQQEREHKEMEEQLRSKALHALSSGQKNAMLQEITDVWRAAAAANRHAREKLAVLSKGRERRQSLITHMEGQLKNTINMRHLRLEGILIRWSKAEETNSLKATVRSWRKVTSASNIQAIFDRDKASLIHLVSMTDYDALMVRGCFSTWNLQSWFARIPAAVKMLEEQQWEQVNAERRHAEAAQILTSAARLHEDFSFCCFFVLAWRRLLEENVMDNTALQINAHLTREEQRVKQRSHAIATSCSSLQELSTRKAIKEKSKIVWRKVFTAWSQWGQSEKVFRDFERRRQAAQGALTAQCRFEEISRRHYIEKCVDFEHGGIHQMLKFRCFLAWEVLAAKSRVRQSEQKDKIFSERIVNSARKLVSIETAQQHLSLIGWRRAVIDAKERWLKGRRVKLEAALASQQGISAVQDRTTDLARLRELQRARRGSSDIGSPYIAKVLPGTGESTVSTPLVQSTSLSAFPESTPFGQSQSIASTSAPAVSNDGPDVLNIDFAARMKQFKFGADTFEDSSTKEATSPSITSTTQSQIGQAALIKLPFGAISSPTSLLEPRDASPLTQTRNQVIGAAAQPSPISASVVRIAAPGGAGAFTTQASRRPSVQTPELPIAARSFASRRSSV